MNSKRIFLIFKTVVALSLLSLTIEILYRRWGLEQQPTQLSPIFVYGLCIANAVFLIGLIRSLIAEVKRK